jgi:hypothetical protein
MLFIDANSFEDCGMSRNHPAMAAKEVSNGGDSFSTSELNDLKSSSMIQCATEKPREAETPHTHA